MGTSMDFTEKSFYTGPQPCFSPSYKYIAVCEDTKVVVREINSMAVVALFSCLDSIEALHWSPSGDYIMCAMYSRGTVQVFSITDSGFSCSITEGLAGITSAQWCPDSQHILLTADFQVKLSIWSLIDQSCEVILPPKYPDSGVLFSPDSSMLALLERSECKDILTVYDSQSWQVISRIFTSTQDAAGISWSPDSSCIAVYDNYAYGHLLEVYTPTGEHLATHDKGTYLLGIKSSSWSPSGQLLAIGGHEQDAWILNNVTWSSLATLNHPSTVVSPPSIEAYQEEVITTSTNSSTGKSIINGGALSDRRQNTGATVHQKNAQQQSKRNTNNNKKEGSSTAPPQPYFDSNNNSNAADDDSTSRFIVTGLPLKLPAPRPPADRPNPKIGISIATWSADGTYLATRCDARPHIIWIWDSSRLELASIMHLAAPVKTVEWDPSGRPQLAVGCGTRKIYMWMPTGATVVKTPHGVRASSLVWNGDGSSLLIIGKESFCIANY